MLNFLKGMFSQTKKSQDDGTPPPKNDKSHPSDKSNVPPVKEPTRKVSPSRGGNREDNSEREPAITSNETSVSTDDMTSFYTTSAKQAKKCKSRTNNSNRRAPTTPTLTQKDDFEWKCDKSFKPANDTVGSGPPAKKQRVGHMYVYKRNDPNFECDNEIMCMNCNLLFGYLPNGKSDEIVCTQCHYYCHHKCMASSEICEYCYKMMN